ncbi:MAG: glycosyltransferase family 2 protein, partial [Candidatus Binatia bacterium]
MKSVSILIPVFNEAENVDRAYEAVTRVFRSLADRYAYEILFTDNHSTDGTYDLLQAIAARDSRVRVVRFSKNFGLQQSIFAGYALSQGDAAVQLDCDLQDPPEMIPQFLAAWEEGYQVVYGVRRSRNESRLIALARRIFYRLMRRIGNDPLPLDAGDFRLVDRRLLREITKFWDYNPFLRASIAWMGFRQKGIPYDRAGRAAGESKFSFAGMASFALDGLVAHSILPLRLATYAGFTVGALAVAGFLFYLVGKFAFGQSWPVGLTTVLLLLMISISMNGLFLGVIGEYLGRLYLQSKGRPVV